MIDHFDHIVLTVEDFGRSIDFYERALKMEPIVFGQDRKALTFGSQKINLQQVGDEPRNNAAIGAGDFCLITYAPLDNVIEHLKSENVELLDGPVLRNGAQGPIRSIYFNDPDGNLIEVSSYAEAAKVIK